MVATSVLYEQDVGLSSRGPFVSSLFSICQCYFSFLLGFYKYLYVVSISCYCGLGLVGFVNEL